MRLREHQDDCEAVAEFIDTVPSRLNARNERVQDDLNTLVATFTTDLDTTTDIQPTIAAVRHPHEAARAHNEHFTNPRPQLQDSRLDPVTLHSPQP